MAFEGGLAHAVRVPPEYIDLHCHWVSGVDDGARSAAESRDLLAGLARLGFAQVFATPHMRPGMFENAAEDIERAYDACVAALGQHAAVVGIGLACEHYLDDIVLGRLLRGEGRPYPGGRAVLVECARSEGLRWVEGPIRSLRRLGMRPVLAHPERLPALWRDPQRLEEIMECGAAPLLDVASLVGTYGRQTLACARQLLELGLYDAACSDAHRPEDLIHVERGLDVLQSSFGAETVEALLVTGPAALLDGRHR